MVMESKYLISHDGIHSPIECQQLGLGCIFCQFLGTMSTH